MNPFEWRGPQFLAFYVLFAIAAAALLHLLRRALDRTQPVASGFSLNDPYEIAYLRGGRNEAIRVAVLALIERGWLAVHDKTELSAKGGIARATDPLERAVLEFFGSRRPAAEAFKHASELELSMSDRRQALQRAGLLPDERRFAFRLWLSGAAAAVLIWVSLTKYEIAEAAGRTNTGLLPVFTVFALIGVLWTLHRFRRTPQGDDALSGLQELLSRLQHSARDPWELLMVAALFGVAALPATAMPYAADLYPRAAAGGDGGDGGSSCGSSCGGGGGCGGGGCGGCGS